MFGWFKKKKKEVEPEREENPSAPGWEAIDAAFARLYPPERKRHWAHNGVHRMHDLNNPPENPLEGVNIYDAGTFWHYVGLGLSDLFAKESKGEWSGFGYELTLRVKKQEGEAEPPFWPINLLFNLARIPFTGKHLASGHTLKTGPLDIDSDSKTTALLVLRDPAFEVLETPHGKLEFLLLLGVEGSVREQVLERGFAPVLEELQRVNPQGLTTL